MAHRWPLPTVCDDHGPFYVDTYEQPECPACKGKTVRLCPVCKQLVEPEGRLDATGIYEICPNDGIDISDVRDREYDKYSDLYQDELERMEG